MRVAATGQSPAGGSSYTGRGCQPDTGERRRFAGSRLLPCPGRTCVLVPVQILWLLGGGRLSWSGGELVSAVWAELLTRTGRYRCSSARSGMDGGVYPLTASLPFSIFPLQGRGGLVHGS